MSYKNKLLPGRNIDLEIEEGEYQGKYRSRIEDVGSKVVMVGTPYAKGVVVPLREGTQLTITFWDEISAYSFTGRVMQRVAVPVPMLVLELPESISKIQRRNFVRIPAFFPLAFRMVTKEGLSDAKGAMMVDLSGGGMRFKTEEDLDNNSLLFAQMKLPSGEIQTPVRVCRKEKIDNTKQYVISVEFHDLSDRDRDRIIRCVFELQREMRRKGLI